MTAPIFVPDELHTSGVYGIFHIETNRCYIGEAHWITYRWHTHYLNLNKGKHACAALQDDWLRYGSGAFRCKLIRSVADPKLRLLWEAYHMTFDGYDLYNHQTDIKMRRAKTAHKDYAKRIGLYD